MKKWIIGLMASGMVLGVSAGVLDQWDMNDSVGTSFATLSNSGPNGGNFGSNATGITTDGNGHLVFAGDGGQVFKSGSTFTSISTGVSTFTVNFAGWNFDAASAGDLMLVRFKNAANQKLAEVELSVNATGTGTQVRLVSGNSNYRGYTFGLVEGAHSFEVEVDFDNNTSQYTNDGVFQESFTAGIFDNLTSYQINAQGAWGTAASSVSVDSIIVTSTTVPEPATFGLMGIAGLALFLARKKMRV